MVPKNMILFNVGGHIYTIPRSLLERFPDTVMARQVDKIWQEDESTPHFIDRNGIRFQYVMDLMRDGQVHLPLTISKQAFLNDMDYLGFTNDDIDKWSIHVGTVAENEDVVAAVSDNLHDEIDELEAIITQSNKTIEECQIKKCALKVAHDLFARSSGHDSQQKEVTIKMQKCDALIEMERASFKSMTVLKECLAKYGLNLVSYESYDVWTNDARGVITLKRNDNKRKRIESGLVVAS